MFVRHMPATGAVAAVILRAALAAVPVTEIGGANALTLPAQRHLVRVVHSNGTASLLLAIQQDGAGGHGLGFFRSDDEGLSWGWMAAIQDDPTERDTPDIIQLGQDMALVYSYEGPALGGSTRHDVYYQRWRYQSATQSFTPDPPLRVFDSTSSSTAYYRAEIAADSAGRLWVQAFRLNANGTHAAAIAVSQNGGQSFT
ncbi:MAG TPA: exo-alpha-sialidase, partial [Myxococcaceae bacterium]